MGLIVAEAIHGIKGLRNGELPRVSLEGNEHVRAALKSGRELILFTGHVGNFCALAACARRLGPDVYIVPQRLPSRHLDRRMEAMMNDFGAKRLVDDPNLLSRFATIFQQNAILVMFIDIRLRNKHDVWVPFGNAQIKISLGSALIALRHRVPDLWTSCARLHEGRHQITVHPPFCQSRSGQIALDARRLTQQAIQAVATEILRRPNQWTEWDDSQLRTHRDSTATNR